MDTPLNYWRSKSGLEVDFVLGHGNIAIETKISSTIDISELRGLVAFCEDYKPHHALVVCQAPRKRIIATIGHTKIEILPWREFLENLWNGVYQFY